ncbi:MAG TPA: hypothetical protein VHA57_04300 [Actinomycetota bacterium]|nr:hypothetical protein [Actinomycetota bacterium]
MDEVLVNANQIENSPHSTTTVLRKTGLPFSIDPMLTRFQSPDSLRNDKGNTKQNYKRLVAMYGRGTDVQFGSGPLVDLVRSEASWRLIARNVIDYQWNRLVEEPTQLDLFSLEQNLELRPARVIAPALMAASPAEDHVNQLLAEASAEVAQASFAVPVIVPLRRLLQRRSLDSLLNNLPTDRVNSYLVWTPGVSEATLLADPKILTQLLRLTAALARRGVPVAHLHGGYAIGALHGLGISAMAHHLGWVDNGDPIETGRGGLRSCRTYVPGLRRTATFENARELGGSLDDRTYAERYCECSFCTGAFENGQHPLDLLLEDQFVHFGDGGGRRTPTGRAIGANTWHYLLSRRLEVQRFSLMLSTEVIEEDIDRAAALAGMNATYGLRRLAAELKAA